MTENKQYLYILSNSERPELIKIGRTDKHPVLRAEQLSRQTGVLGQYVAEWYIEVPDSVIAEKLAHYQMKEYHYQKEFFKTSVSVAIEKIEATLLPFFKIEALNTLTELLDEDEKEIQEKEIKAAIEKIELDLMRVRFINKK